MITTVATERIPSVIIPSHLIDMLFSNKLNWLEIGIYCRLRYRCGPDANDTYEASKADLARIGADSMVLSKLRMLNLICWAFKGDVRQIQMVKR